MTRPWTFVFCSLAIPVLLVWAWALWTKRTRRELPHWRNGLGLAAITLIFAGWSFEIIGLFLFMTRVNWRGFRAFGWYWDHIEIYLFILNPLLALAWKGVPRLQVFVAGILFWVLVASTVIA
jgi:hypothetical protein